MASHRGSSALCCKQSANGWMLKSEIARHTFFEAVTSPLPLWRDNDLPMCPHFQRMLLQHTIAEPTLFVHHAKHPVTLLSEQQATRVLENPRQPLPNQLRLWIHRILFQRCLSFCKRLEDGPGW